MVHTQSICTEVPKCGACSRWPFLKTLASFTCTVPCARVCAPECSKVWEPSTRVNKLLYKMLLFLLNVILMNHFCILMTCILNILLEWYFVLKSHSHVTDQASITNMELNPAFHLLMWILLVQKGQSGFHSWHPYLCCFFFKNAVMNMAGRQQKAFFVYFPRADILSTYH